MVAQVIAAPVMVVGKVATTVAKTSASFAMRAGSTAMRAGLSSARTAGSALRVGLTKSVSTASRVGHGLGSSLRSGPLSRSFSALSNAKANIARSAPKAPIRSVSQGASKTPVGRSIKNATNKWQEREIRRLVRQYHPVEQRERNAAQQVVIVQNGDENDEEKMKNPFLEIAADICRGAKKAAANMASVAANKTQSMMAYRMARREMDSGRSIER